MKFKAKTYILKTGVPVKISVPEIDKAEQLVILKRSYIKDSGTIPMHLEEYPIDLQKESSLITKYLKSQNSILLTAEINNELVGNIDLTGSERSKMYHTAMIGMGIHEKWRNQGLGKCLIEAVLDWAKNHSEIEIIWLDVYASNLLGYNLYQNCGFKVSGVIKDFFKDKDGYKDKVQMYQHIK